jgi:hypothetical protein
MTYEKQIINSFFKRYLTPATGTGKRTSITMDRIYPEFDDAPPDKKAAFLKAAEALEKRGIIKLTWQKSRKREALKKLECIDKEAIFALSGKPFPKTIAKNIKDAMSSINVIISTPCCKELLTFMSENLTLKDIEHGIDKNVFLDFAKLVKILYENQHNCEYKPLPVLSEPYSVLDGITPRALSIMLYNDSKRLEVITKLVSRLLKRAAKHGIYVPDMSFLSRSFPETLIAGKIMIHFNQNKMPLANATGSIIGLPLETVKKIKSISAIKCEEKNGLPSVLTIENKETFYALANSQRYSCLLYTGGYPSRAVNTLVQVLSTSGFIFFHAGDVDPDGILILQDLRKNAKKEITPVCMDAATFNKYRKHGRKLEKSMLNNIRLISDTVRSIKAIHELLPLIESTGIGIEQELIDYGYG